MDNPPAAAPAELPGIGAMLTAATTAALDNVGVLLGLWALFALPIIAGAFAAATALGLQSPQALKDFIASIDGPRAAAVAGAVVVAVALGAIGRLATILAMDRALQGRPVALGELIGAAAARAASAIAASVLTILAVGAGMMLLILPGIYLAVRLSMTVQSVTLDGASATGGLRRSWRLTAGRFWDVLAAIFAFGLAGLAGGAALLAGGALIRVVATAAGGALAGVLASLLSNAVQFVLGGWLSACLVKLYRELAARAPAA